MKCLAICCACAVLALAGCTSTIPSVDPSTFSPPGSDKGTLYGTVVGAGSFDIFTSDGREYSVSVRGSTSTPQLFIVVDRARSFFFPKGSATWADSPSGTRGKTCRSTARHSVKTRASRKRCTEGLSRFVDFPMPAIPGTGS
jgi:hypothetical protein